MDNIDSYVPDYLPEEQATIQRQRKELQTVLRFMNRNYIYLLCHGKLREAEELLRAFRGLGEASIDYSPNQAKGDSAR